MVKKKYPFLAQELRCAYLLDVLGSFAAQEIYGLGI